MTTFKWPSTIIHRVLLFVVVLILLSVIAAILMLVASANRSIERGSNVQGIIEGPIDGRIPSMTDYTDVYDIISREIENSTCPKTNDPNHWDWDPNKNDCNLFPRNRGEAPLGSRLVRQAFHDALGVTDGYVNLNDNDNKEFEASHSVLTRLYFDENIELPSSGDRVRDAMSYADFANWAYIAAVQDAASRQTDNTYVPSMQITHGRISGGNSRPREDIPDVNGGTGFIFDFFRRNFDFSERQALIIMGAHGLGSAKQGNIGINSWTTKKTVLDNEYYANMLSPIPSDCNGTALPDRSNCMNLVEAELCDTGRGNRCLGWELVEGGGRGFGSNDRSGHDGGGGDRRGWGRGDGRMLHRRGRGGGHGRGGDGPNGMVWRHSCDGDGNGCQQIMLNADMALLRDIGGRRGRRDNNSTNPSEDNGCPYVDPTTGRERILASCFPINEVTGEEVEDLALPNNSQEFLDEFAQVFTAMMDARLPPDVQLTLVTDGSNI